MQPFKYVPKLNAGDFRNRIEIQEFEEAINDNGYPVEDWVTKHILWTKIKTVKGSETVSASAEVNTNTYRFIVRYTNGLNTKQRVLFKGQLYDIQAVLNDDELMKTQTIVASIQNQQVML